MPAKTPTKLLTDDDITALGAAIGTAIGAQQGNMPVWKETSLTPGNVSIYGRNSIFSPCSSGDIFGLQVQTHGLMDWLGWRPNRFHTRRVDFITYIGPAGTSDDTATTGATGPCEDPPGWEYGVGGYTLVHKSWYSRSGEALTPHDVTQERCETSPRYRVNGKIITDDVEWQINGMMTAINQSIKHDIIHGSHANPWEMNGLENLIKTGYTDDENIPTPIVDSILLDWEDDDLDGAVNGYGNFFNVLDEIVTEIEFRASAIGTIAENDMALLTSRFTGVALLDAFACYTTCGVTTQNDITDQALRADQRKARRDLNGGPLYDGRTAIGYIHLKSGRRLPILVEDSMLISEVDTNIWSSDIYLLTRTIGSQDVLYGEYLDMRIWENRIRRHMEGFTGRSDEGGRFALKSKEDNFCVQAIVGTSPELYLAAPWAQVRISGVATQRVRTPLVGSPFQRTFMPGGANLYPAYVHGGDVN